MNFYSFEENFFREIISCSLNFMNFLIRSFIQLLISLLPSSHHKKGKHKYEDFLLGATREIKFSVQDFKWKKFQNHTYISEDSHQKTIFIIQLMILGVRNCCEDVHTSIRFTFTFSNSKSPGENFQKCRLFMEFT